MQAFQILNETTIQMMIAGEVIAGFGKKVLLTFGDGSIEKMGLYDKVKELLSGCEIYRLSDVAADPKIHSVKDGIFCREHGIDVILAVDCGSVIDCCKAIASGFYYDGDAWDMIVSHAEITKALPIVTVLTLAATGSKADAGTVISNPETNEKLLLFSSHIFPKISIMDPEYTFTVPAAQTAAGSIDILSHLMEQYFVPASTYMGDLLVEAVMKTVVKYAPVAYAEPDNYEARAQLMWAGTIADNATLCNGNQLAVFGVHGMEHELSAFYDVTHGVGLAILTPRWMDYVLSEETAPRFARFGKEIFGVAGSSDMESAKLAIQALYQFLKSLGVPMSFGALGIGSEHFDEMAKHAVEAEGLAYAWIPLAAKDVKAIYEMCL